MRNYILLAMMAVVLGVSGMALAADDKKADAPKAEKLAVVDVQALMGKSKAGKSIETQVNKQRDAFKEEFSKLEKELVDMQKALEKVDPKSEEFATKRKDLEKRMMEGNRLVQDRRQALDKAASQAVMELEKQIVMTVGEIAKSDGYTLVVRSQSVVVAESNLDITDKVLGALDKKISDVKVNVETPAVKPAEDSKKKS